MGEVLEFRALGLRPGLIKDAILQKCREVHLRDDFSQQMAQALQRVCDEYSLTAPILRLTIDGPENSLAACVPGRGVRRIAGIGA